MRPEKLIHSLNWRYAMGELLLIILGILIALAISDWNDRRLQHQQEQALLREVRTTLEADLAELELRLAKLQETLPRIEELSRRLKTGGTYDPSLDRLFGAAYGVHGINLNTTAYETLKSIGLQSITNLDLRLGITRIFDHHYENILSGRDIGQGVTLDIMRPYFLEHFRDLQFLESATPINYKTIANDTYFHNMIDYRLAVLRNNQMDSYPKAIAEIRSVLGLLEKELK